MEENKQEISIEENIEIEDSKTQKYSAVTGQKLKNKSVKKIKKEHKVKAKTEKKENKKIASKKKKLDKKLDKKAVKYEAKTLSNAKIIENEEDRNRVDSNVEEMPEIKTSTASNNIDENILIVRKTEQKMTLGRKILNLLSYALVGVVAVLFGYFAGNFYYANVMSKVDFSQFNEQTLRDDAKAVYEEVLKKGVANASAIEIFVASEYMLSLEEHYSASCVGSVKPGSFTEQTVRGIKSRNGNIIESSNISRGLMKVAEKYVYNLDTEIAEVYHVEGDKITGADKADFGTTPTSTLNYDEFRAEMGTAPENPLIPYIVSSKTLVEGSESIKSVGFGRYEISFMLKPDSSVLNYVQQVKHMSGFEDFPTFKSVKITAVVDSILKFQSLRYDETYSVLYAVALVECVGYLEQTITY